MASRANHLHQGVDLTGSRGGGGCREIREFSMGPRETALFYVRIGRLGLPVMNLSKFRS